MTELEREFRYSEKREDAIVNISHKISTDVQLLSKDFESHVLNIREVQTQAPNLIDAVKTIESYIQRLGKAERTIFELRKEVQSLEINLEEKNKIIDELENQLSEQTLKKDDNFSL